MSSTSCILASAEGYYRNFPTTFCKSYEDKLHLVPTQISFDFYQMVAQKLAQLYMHSLQWPVSSVVPIVHLPQIEDPKIEKFGKVLKDYILGSLLSREMVSLKTERVPKGKLQELLLHCGIDLVSEAARGVFFLPYRSEVFLNPYFSVDEYLHVEGLHISMSSDYSRDK
jgi:hypothetical protein